MLVRWWWLIGLVACTQNDKQARESQPDALKQESQGTNSTYENVILITVDTLRPDAMSLYGGPAQTPQLATYSDRALVFEQCISASMLTNPSHASMMTSLYPRDHGVYDNESGIADGTRTIALAMRDAGRKTLALIGFPHLNPKVSNLGQGFDVVHEASRDERRAHQTTTKALRMLGELADEQSFFAWLHYVDPHAPYEPMDPHRARRPETSTPMIQAKRAAPSFQKNNEWFARAFDKFTHTEDLVQRYYAEIEETDEALGALLRGLQELGRLDNTLVVLTSDHGENLGEHNLYFHHGGLYRSAVHVPLWFYGTGIAGTRRPEVVSTVDIAPTILDLAGVAPWHPMRGRSIAKNPVSRPAFSEHMFGQLVSVRNLDAAVIRHRKKSKLFPSYPIIPGRYEHLVASEGGEYVTSATSTEHEILRLQLSDYLGAGLGHKSRPAIAQDRESLRALGYVID